MKGVILAGGTGSRLLPLTQVTNKHLLPVGRQPMILWPVGKLTEAGIRDILIVTGTEHMGDIVNLLGSGAQYGCEFTYKVQDHAGGIAQALGLARNFAAGGKLCVILGDNIFEDSLHSAVAAFEAQPAGAQILLKHVPDANRYGVAELDAQGRVVGIEEKPAKPKSDCAVTGIYFYDATVFDVIPTLKPSRRNELEITDVNNHYLRAGSLRCSFLRGAWTDAGTFKSLAHANRLLEEAGLGGTTIPGQGPA